MFDKGIIAEFKGKNQEENPSLENVDELSWLSYKLCEKTLYYLWILCFSKYLQFFIVSIESLQDSFLYVFLYLILKVILILF